MKYLLQLLRRLGFLPVEETIPEPVENAVEIGPLLIHTSMGLSPDAVKDGVVRATAQLQYVKSPREYRVFVTYYDRNGSIVCCGYGIPIWLPEDHESTTADRLAIVRRAVTHTYTRCRRKSHTRTERTVLL